MRMLSCFFGILVWCSMAFAQQAPLKDYVLNVDGVEHELALGQETKIKLKSGVEIPVTLSRREFSRFAAGKLSFEYPGKFTVASTAVDEDTKQHIVVTALGTIMLVQHYQKSVPPGILDLMYEKMIEEPKALGWPIEKTDLSHTIATGQNLKGTRARYKGSEDDVTIDITVTELSTGGFLVLTMHDNYTSPEEKPIIERFWKNLTLDAP